LLYQSDAQAVRWLAVHQACSPWVRDERCRRFYRDAFAELAARFAGRELGVLSLGCGSGEKDALLLAALRNAGASARYRPHDVSPALARAAAAAAQPFATGVLTPVVAALGTDPALRRMFTGGFDPAAPLLTLMLGLSPNFLPAEFFACVAAMAESGAVLLSANLAPGADYAAGLAAVLPQYDNSLTREWLEGALAELGLQPEHGTLAFGLSAPEELTGARSIVATCQLARDRELAILGERWTWRAGEVVRVFFSFRYTPALMAGALRRHGLRLEAQWLSPTEDEGLFLARRAAA
jgi:SAM-dependent methyltransferase